MRGILTRSSQIVWFTLLMTLGSLASYAQCPPPLITFTNTMWSYHSNKTSNPPNFSPPDAWTAVDFDDSAWPKGVGLFGTEVAGEYPYPFNTHIDNPAAGGAGVGPLSDYFRTHFQWSGPTDNISLLFSNHVDDGILVFLNGTELFSFNVPDTRPLPWDSLMMPNGANPGGEPVLHVTNVLATSLVVGDNVLAVALYEQLNTTSDDVFGMSMSPPSAPINLAPNQPTNRVVRQNVATTLIVNYCGSPTPTFQWYEDGVPIGGDSPTLRVTNTEPGTITKQYYCHVENPSGSFDSRVASVTSTTDSEAPRVVRVTAGAAGDTVVVEYSELMAANTAGDYLNYQLQGPNAPGILNSTALNADGSSVTLVLGSALTEGERYTVVIDFVTDLALNEMPHAEVPFSAWVSNPCGGLLFEVYNGSLTPGIDGHLGLSDTATVTNTVAALTQHSTYPNQPTEVFRIARFDSREAYPDDSHENYGGRLRGVFLPPISGSWRFYLRSDDPSELWFNANGPGANGKSLIAFQTGCCNNFTAPGPAVPFTSAAIPLTAGQAYYIEALYKEGTGGDYCQVAARLDGDVVPVTPTGTAACDECIPAGWLGSALPGSIVQNVTITQQPAAASVPAGQVATFTVGTSTDVPLCYQWQRDGVDIPGANSPAYSFLAINDDDGALFSVVITLPGGGTLASGNAKLTVAIDTTAPTLVSAVADSGTQVTLTFSERIDATSAGNVNNYSINGAAPASATLQGNATTVVLTTATPLTPCADSRIQVSGILDLSQNPISPNPSVATVAGPVTLVPNTDAFLWKYDYSGTDLGTAWRDVGFDDSSWQSGPAPIGFEDAAQMPANYPIRTALNPFDPLKNVLYMRSHFTMPTHPSTVTKLTLLEVVDDGSVVYINGIRANLNRLTDPISYATFAGASAEPHPIESFDLPANLLRQGDNVIAVEIHQTSNASSDILYGAEAVAFVSRCVLGLTITPVSATQVRLNWSDPTFSVQKANSISGPWAAQPGVVNGSVVTIAPPGGFFRLIK